CVTGIAFEYEDTLGNRYRVIHSRPAGATCGISQSTPGVGTSHRVTASRRGITRQRQLGIFLETGHGVAESVTVSGRPFSEAPLRFGGVHRFLDSFFEDFVVVADLAADISYPPTGTAFSIDVSLRGSTEHKTVEATLDAVSTDDEIVF